MWGYGKDPSTKRWEGGVRVVERVSKRFCEWWLVNISQPLTRRPSWLQNTYKALLPAAPAYAEKTGFPEATAVHSQSGLHNSSQPNSFTYYIGNHHLLSLLIWGLVWKIKKKHFICVKYFCDYMYILLNSYLNQNTIISHSFISRSFVSSIPELYQLILCL